jgi:hypothetical protein
VGVQVGREGHLAAVDGQDGPDSSEKVSSVNLRKRR